MRILKWFAWIVAAIAGLVAALIVGAVLLLWSDHGNPTTLPAPSGPFAVGRVNYEWVNPSAPEPFAPSADFKQTVIGWVWFPAVASSSDATVEYFPAAWREALEQAEGWPNRTLFSRDLALVHPHSLADATVSPAQAKYPVVIFRAGLGALTTEYAALAEDLASHGYIVVGIDAPYRTWLVVMSDGRVIRRPDSANPETLPEAQAVQLATQLEGDWQADFAFSLDQLQKMNTSDARFAGHLDLDHVGVMGHSLGGATAAQFCHDDARCKASVDIDGRPFGSVIQEGVNRPFMFLMSDHSRETDAESREIMGEIAQIYQRLPPASRWQIAIRGTDHFSFTDQLLIRNQRIIWLMHNRHIIGTDGPRGLAVASGCLRDFFDVYLKGASAQELEGEFRSYPEVEFQEK